MCTLNTYSYAKSNYNPGVGEIFTFPYLILVDNLILLFFNEMTVNSYNFCRI